MGNKSAFQGTPYGKTTLPFKDNIMSGYALKTRYEKETGKSWKAHYSTAIGGDCIPYVSWLEAEIDRLTTQVKEASVFIEQLKADNRELVEISVENHKIYERVKVRAEKAERTIERIKQAMCYEQCDEDKLIEIQRTLSEG